MSDSKNELLAVGLSEPEEALLNIYKEINKRPTNPSKVASAIVGILDLLLIFGGPFVESMLTKQAGNKGEVSYGFGNLPQLFGITILVAVVMVLFTQVYLGMALTGKGRKLTGYGVPVMQASLDIHVLDVARGGKILSGGDLEAAKKALNLAVTYNCHQRAHANAMESLPLILPLMLISGLRYPVLSAIHGFLWIVGRATYAVNYTSGKPMDRYNSPFSLLVWGSLLGFIATSVGLAIGVFQNANYYMF
jgi:glutathione S-transferase